MRLLINVIAAALFLIACEQRPYLTEDMKLQEDLDHLRLNHLEYWTALIEEYHSVHGTYPLQNQLSKTDKIVHVQILPPRLSNEVIDWGDSFEERSTIEFIDQLQNGLDQKINGKFPPEATPPGYAFAYNYFVEPNGYVFWVACQSCGITEISTYTMDGKSATVNITSEKMLPKVTKALTRGDMLAHPRYKIWRSIKLHDPARAEEIERNSVLQLRSPDGF